VDALNELLTSGGLAIVSDAVTIAGIAIALVLLNWPLALITFVVIPPLLIATNIIRDGMRDSFRAVRIRLARVNATIAENISGIHVIQLFNRELEAYRAFDALNRDLLQAHLRGVLYFALFWPIVSVAAAVTLAAIVWYGGSQVLSGLLTVGGVVAFIQYVDRFFQPIRDLSEKYNIMQQAMASSERIFLILDTRPTVRDAAQPRELERLRGEIEFRDTWFAYEPGNWVLKGVSFRIREGEKVAIVGATGAGKTSIISLVSRFYDVQKGQVLVDGMDVRDVRQADLRRQVGVVLQDPFLFSGTIARNIRLNETRITDADVRAAARYVDADDFITTLPEGYDAQVRERGAGLSVGQKQLIAFARAIAFNPAMLLVLDEATANVDTETEWRIQRALERLMEGRTSIIIAHRLSTIRKVDRILVLHKGRLVEEGTHDELLARDGRYARLYELQWRTAEGVSLSHSA
jgi:ATP-binding cassette subfamily B multidrug efflux pump